MVNFLTALAFTLLPACAVEDANNCKWDAASNGNGRGQSFIVLFEHQFNVGAPNV